MNFKTSKDTCTNRRLIGQGKKEPLPTNDPVIGSYRDPSQRYDSDQTVRYY